MKLIISMFSNCVLCTVQDITPIKLSKMIQCWRPKFLAVYEDLSTISKATLCRSLNFGVCDILYFS